MQEVEKIDAKIYREESEEVKAEEIRVLSQYFEGSTNYYVKEVPKYMSFTLNEKFRELTIPDCFIFREKSDDIIGVKGYYGYIFSSRAEGIKMLNRLEEEGIGI